MSQARLAELLGYMAKGEPNRAHVSRLIKKLEGFGYLKNSGQRGYNKTNLYRLSVPKNGDFRAATHRQLPDDDYRDALELSVVRQQGCESAELLIAEIEGYDADKG